MTYGLTLSQFTRYLQSGRYSRDDLLRKAITWAVVRLFLAFREHR